ncbi:uncharacterized protein LOC106168377 [Lingula anatina]|uniref:Uncharacterized protein LOC106168377 n=1 Tax=Lingula anatina TaxID=7574 RepID=A0A1S3IXD5_LINAN|nr:uncharacterized protein LOC106168377 [Lingula anatina]|eukprot:XP_013402867.1 uncharacterized protein LOC106168377 [Lingula anatina]
MDKNKLWTDKVDLRKFLTYVQEQYGCETLEQLGVRVKSVGLAISVIKSAQKHQKNWNTEARGKLKNELIEQMDKKLHKIKNQLQESILKDESNTTKKKSQFADMAAADVVQEVFNRCQTIFSANFVDPDYVVTPFLRILSTDEFARKLFQLCLCTAGDLEIPHLADNIDSQAEGQASEMEGEMHAGPTRPTEAVLFKQLSQTLSSYTSAMNLRAMAHLEKRLAQHFGFQDFHSMGHGSFTEFLGHHSKELEELGMGSVGGGPGTGHFTATKDSVLQFIRQCGNDLPSDTIGEMLCGQFKVKKPTDLGCGTVQKLVEGARDGATPHSVVYYEAASVVSQGNSGSHHKTIEEALECLTSAPLLADLSTWSHWEVIFEPQFGPLKTFIEKHSKDCAGNIVKDISDLYCVEMAPGILLRITMTTSDKQFKLALEQGNTRDAAGHLVSIFLRDGGLKNAPLALLDNHVTTVLHSMAGKGSIGQIHSGLQEAETAEDVQARLTLDCLTKLPKRICKAVARQVFLEPLGKTVGKVKAYQLLLKVSRCIEDKLCLESLGLSLGISEWTESLWAQMKSSADPMDDSFTQEFSDEESEEELPSDVKPKQEQMEVVSETAERLLSEAAVDNQQEILMENTECVDSNNTHDVSDASSVEPTQTLETKDEACSEKETKCFNVIQDIRLEKFGIGLELDEKGQKLAQGLNELVGRSLDKLSQELYNKDTHFVLELIQNADDNDYPTAQWSEAGSSECPELVFVVEEDCITLYNNEKGFSERNIRAICDVGQSTKGKHKQGYIGQKGIGFKSVFIVTNTPEIVSNGYCIRFDANSGPTGYILPHWVSEEDRERPHESFYVTLTGGKKSKKKSKVLVDLSDERWTTKITLPLKTQTEQEKLKNRSLTSSFHDVHPSLLLFLNRLKRLIVINKVNKETEVMHRRDLGNGVIEIQTSKKTERWLLHKKMLPVPEELNPSVESTELALAFPLQTDGKTSQGEPPKQDVFAFLPLRCFGFKFVVQGDFEIPASRQDILQDRQWNQWLRSHLPELFVDSLDCFQKHPEFDKISAVVAFLKHVPVEGELYDFFQPVAKQILQHLQKMPCLPVRKEEGSEWKTPTEIVMCKHKGTVEIVTPEHLLKYLGRYYLDQAVQKSVSSVLLN